jgi:two-component system sensor histidine kinase ChiS
MSIEGQITFQHAPIIVVEDDPFDVLLLTNTLATIGDEEPVVVCDDGKGAIATFLDLEREAHTKSATMGPTVFIDLNLPGIDGFTLIKWLRDRRSFGRALIVVVSGSENPADVAAAFAAGANDFIRKPADAAVLREVLGIKEITPRIGAATTRQRS